MKNNEDFYLCLDAAFRFLSYRPRSEAETRLRLQKLGYEDKQVEKVITNLKNSKLLDDKAFAEYWKENRNSFKPRGQRMLRSELKYKGVDSEVIDEVVEDADDKDNAYRSAMKRARSLPLSDYAQFRRRLSGYLQRRGFEFGVINSTVKKAWEERLNQGSEVQGSKVQKLNGER
jgi:regulatory protein